MERVDSCSSTLSGRMDWRPQGQGGAPVATQAKGSSSDPPSSPAAPPGGEPTKTMYTGRSYQTKCIQRDRLASCLLQVEGGGGEGGGRTLSPSSLARW